MNRKNNLTAYLSNLGLLQHGSPEEITEAKRIYRKAYQQRYMRRYREGRIEVRFLLDTCTAKGIEQAARSTGLDLHRYAKESTIARYQGRSYGSDQRIKKEVLLRISLIHGELRELCRRSRGGLFERRSLILHLEERVRSMERLLREDRK